MLRDMHTSYKLVQCFPLMTTTPLMLNTIQCACCCVQDPCRLKLRAAVEYTLKKYDLVALVFPQWSNFPRMVGDEVTPMSECPVQLPCSAMCAALGAVVVQVQRL